MRTKPDPAPSSSGLFVSERQSIVLSKVIRTVWVLTFDGRASIVSQGGHPVPISPDKANGKHLAVRFSKDEAAILDEAEGHKFLLDLALYLETRP